MKGRMKKIVASLAVIALLFSVSVAKANGPDSLLLAKEIASNQPDVYSISAGYDVVQDGNLERHEMRAIYKPNKGIIWLEINGSLVIDYGDEPEMGLPRPIDCEVSNFYAAVCAYSEGESVMYGWAWYDQLIENQSIDFYMSLFQKRHFIKWFNTYGSDDLTIRIYNSYGEFQSYSYDPVTGGFDVYLDPGYSNFNYQIISGSGYLIATGTAVVSNDETSLSSGGSPLNFRLPNNIKSIDITSSSVNLSGLTEDTTVIGEDGLSEPASVFIINKNPYSEMYGYIYNQIAAFTATYELYELTDDGQMVLIFRSNQSTDFISLGAYSSSDKMILVIKGLKSPDGTFNISVYEGGGKG